MAGSENLLRVKNTEEDSGSRGKDICEVEINLPIFNHCWMCSVFSDLCAFATILFQLLFT